jgi:hypothetical protein
MVGRGWYAGLVFGALLLAGQDAPALDVPSALAQAEAAIASGKPADALPWIDRALERDPRSLPAWDLRARWAESANDRDELAYARFRAFRLAVAQHAPKKELAARRAKLAEADPVAKDLIEFTARFVGKLAPIAEQYEKEGRRHAAIRLHNEVLALDPERVESSEAIERISAAPDPSLAESAKPKDLLADVSAQWIAEHDAKHDTWDTAAQLERANYTTHTDAGYEVLVRAGEAMEHMNAFYRRFFHYGEDGKKAVPRIALNIFKTRDEYLKLGQGPPVEWSGGHFTGSAVETYVGGGGFSDTTNTLFHEAAHQFVGLATNAVGWLNEGLASFFEGSRMLANGTVRTNMPANHRLFPLADRMTKGWMKDAKDGIAAPGAQATDPPTAPTLRIVVENDYEWGPPWYAPTWGVVYFLYNYQDEGDGRFVYREGFHEFIDASGGRTGKSAVENFEKVILAHPAKPTQGFKPPEGVRTVALPKTIDELNEVWKDWILRLRAEQSGQSKAARPYLRWARCAITRKDWTDAAEHFENGLAEAPLDFDLNVEFAEHLADRMKNGDRAVKLLLLAQRIAESATPPDAARATRVEKLLARIDPSLATLQRIQGEIVAGAQKIADAYAAAGLPLMTMDAARRFGVDLAVPGMMERYEAAARKARRPLALWECAYDGKTMRGFADAERAGFRPDGEEIAARLGTWSPGAFQYQPLPMERVTSGDFSIESEVDVESGKGQFAGLVFGLKSTSAFHALILNPSVAAAASSDGQPRSASVDLTSFFGGGQSNIWRHNPVGRDVKGWHTLRADIAGAVVDVWFDGELVVSQEFATQDALRGGFGLFTGVGETRFRNVRFLARDKGDPTAQIERKLLMEKIRASGGAIGGSWLGQVPPFPNGVKWLKNPRSSWTEKGPVPTLLVFWSMKQNNIIPIRAWLQDLAARYADVGLEVVAISQPDDVKKVEQHLQYEPFPGAVAVDQYANDQARFGATFDAYSVGSKFSLPRLVLLDVDAKVVWEGDPGITANAPWVKGSSTYIDLPLRKLVEDRKLREIATWRKAWFPRGARAAAEGDFDTAWPLLKDAAALPCDSFADVRPAASFARRLAAALESADALSEFAAPLAETGREPAIAQLLEWSRAIKAPAKPGKAAGWAKDDVAQAWTHASKKAVTTAKSLPPGQEADALRALATEIEAAPGAFPKELAADISKALAANDLDAAKRACAESERAPARWLLAEALAPK